MSNLEGIGLSSSELASIEQAMLSDRFRLRKLSKKLKQKATPELLEKFRDQLNRSIDLVSTRRNSLPEIEFPSDLPVNQKRDEIRDLIKENQTVIVCGETGSGKSTQLPKICLEAGFGIHGFIGHTQPRRIAARSVASRIAQELKTELGNQVGYKVRFNDRTSSQSLIKLMTDGVLLAETQFDRFLEHYDVLIIDEAHERSLNIDFLLGFLKTLLPRRPDMRLIITSATIDAERFSKHFGNADTPAPIIEVSGRNYPVDILYRPIEESEQGQRDYFDGINDAVLELFRTEPGDVLIFLPTEKDIRTAAKKLRGLERLQQGRFHAEILPLYARLSVAEQNRIFNPGQARRIVLATNVAESSLTVPRIKYVIDTGLARISRYSTRSKIQRLPIENISQASANQRAGRCGRLGPGVCVRLFAEDDFENRDPFTTPEIRRTNLASVILQAKSMHFGDVERIEFLDPPRTDSIRDGYKTLFEIGATDGNRNLTDVGNRLKKFPCDPRISRIILAGDEEGVLADVLIIAAALEVQDVRDRPVEKSNQADQAHAKFVNGDSDFMTLLNIWDFYHDQKAKLSNSQLRKSLQANFLSFIRIREWLDVYRQLRELCQQQKIKLGKRKNLYDNIHRALLAGMLSGLGLKGDKHEYEGAGGTRFFLWPGSGVIDQAPRWILGTEVVETSRRFIRNVARIQPNWIEPLAKHLVKKTQSDPFWHEKSEKVMANEKVSLFGITVVPKRMAPFAKHDPVLARQIFIEQGLVEGRMAQRHAFQKQNHQTILQAKDMVDKSRDRDLIVEETRVYQFYEERLPENIVDGDSLRKWIKADQNNDRTLQFQISDLIERPASSMELYPDTIATQTLDLNLEYNFEPGSDRDGISTTVPTAALSQLNASRLEWLVPGILPAKIESLIRSLPKSKRRWFAPIQETAKSIADQLEFAKGDLYSTVANALSRTAEEPINVDDFDLAKIDHHLRMNIHVTDDEGKVLDSSRDLLKLQEQYCESDSISNLARTSETWNQEGLKDWSFDEIPDEMAVSHGGMEMIAFPAIVDTGNSVGLKVLPTRQMADHETELGIMRLAALKTQKSIKKQLRWLPGLESHAIVASQFTSIDALHRDLADLIARRAFIDLAESVPRYRAEFDSLLGNSVEYLSKATQDIAVFLPRFFDSYQEMSLAIADASREKLLTSLESIDEQLSRLLIDRFWVVTPWNWLLRFPVYFQSIVKRLERLSPMNSSQDQELELMLRSHFDTYAETLKRQRAQGIYDPELVKYRFMIEELRISLFSQQLGTVLPVSEKRLQKQEAKFQ